MFVLSTAYPARWAQFHLEVDFGVRDFEMWSRGMGQSDGPAPVENMAEA